MINSNNQILNYLKERQGECALLSGKKYWGLSLKSIKDAAQEFNFPGRMIELVALKNNIIPSRYQRNIGTIGIAGQVKLLHSTVAIVGVGGLGGVAVELLARYGVGNIIVIDHDKFTESTLNRQIIATEKSIGKFKTQITAERITAINSSISITQHALAITEENAKNILKGTNVIIDGLDTISARFVVEKAAKEMDIPFVYATIAGFIGQIMTIFPQDKGLSLLYDESRHSGKGDEVAVGNPSATPAMVAAWEAQEAVKILVGIGKPLRNRLLLLNAIDGTTEIIALSPNKCKG